MSPLPPSHGGQAIDINVPVFRQDGTVLDSKGGMPMEQGSRCFASERQGRRITDTMVRMAMIECENQKNWAAANNFLFAKLFFGKTWETMRRKARGCGAFFSPYARSAAIWQTSGNAGTAKPEAVATGNAPAHSPRYARSVTGSFASEQSCKERKI